MTISISNDLIYSYLKQEDKENANKFESYTKLRGYIADAVIKEFALDNMYSEDIMDAHRSGKFHIHNLGDAIVPYCKGHDATKLLQKGLITQTVVSKPPKHFASFLNQLVNLICYSQQSWAGAQAISNINTLAAPFVRKDKLSYDEVKQAVQNFIFDLNFPSRAGSQTPFTNITLNFKCPDMMKDEPVLCEGCEGTWGDYETESLMIMKAFDEVFRGGDAVNNPFTFPIVTINLTKDTPYESELWKNMMLTQLKYGTYSFFNYDGSGIDPNMILSMCCRLSIDLSLLAPTGGRWAYAGETGSIGVITLNMGRLGYEARDYEDLLNRLDKLLDMARRALLIKGIFVEQHKDRFMPLDKIYGTDLTRFFRTIGICGLEEMTINFEGQHLSEDPQLSVDILNHIREWTRTTQQTTGVLWNIEMTPAESTASDFAEKDKKMYPDIYVMGKEGSYYQTSMITPPSQNLGMWERIAVEQLVIPLFSGGTSSRLYLGEQRPSPEVLSKLIQKIAHNTKITYFDFAVTFSVCENTHFFNGAVYKCPTCGGKVTPFDRIVGYYRPRENSNAGRKAEIEDRLPVNLQN